MMVILEIIGGLMFFGFMGFLSLLLLPGLFGCFGFLFIVVVLGSLIVFFSLNLVWVVLFGSAYYLLMAVFKYVRYNKLPTYDGYLAANPNVYQDGKVCCSFCSAEHISHIGLFGVRSKLRYYVCLRCRNWLYRFKVL